MLYPAALMEPTALTSLSSFLALSISICALFVAYRTSGRYLSKRLNELSTSYGELVEMNEKLSHQLRNIRSRLNMQAHRARKRGQLPDDDEEASDEELPLAGPRPRGLSGDEWRRKMNLQLLAGRNRK